MEPYRHYTLLASALHRLFYQFLAWKNYQGSCYGKIEPLLHMMEAVANERGKTIAQVALNWLLSKDERIIPIPGAKNARQAADNAGAIGWRLSDEEFRKIDLAARF